MRNTYFLLRHGEATHNIRGMISSGNGENGDAPRLTERGRKEIEAVAEELSSDGIDLIYSSPYKRTMETSTIVAERLGLEVNKDARLRELDTGIFDGKTEEEFDEYFKDDEERLEKAPDGGENINDVRARAEDFINDMDKAHSGKNILVVSHGDVLWMLEAVLEMRKGNEMFQLENYETGELRVLKGF